MHRSPFCPNKKEKRALSLEKFIIVPEVRIKAQIIDGNRRDLVRQMRPTKERYFCCLVTESSFNLRSVSRPRVLPEIEKKLLRTIDTRSCSIDVCYVYTHMCKYVNTKIYILCIMYMFMYLYIYYMYTHT